MAALGSLIKWVRENDLRASRQRETASFFVRRYTPQLRDAELIKAWKAKIQSGGVAKS